SGSEHDGDRTRRAAAGAGWLYAFRWLERLLDFLAVVVLARLLSPDDFGLVAIAASMVAILEGLAAFDVTKALIHHRDDDRELYDTAFTLSALRGLLVALVMLALAPWPSDERLGAVLAALALSPLLTGLSNPRFVTFERDLRYSPLAALTLGAKTGYVVVTLVVAVLTGSYWALVLGTLTSSFVSLVSSYALRPYRPRPSLRRARQIFAFSGWLSLTTAVTTISMETDKLIVGRLLGVADAGRYFVTQRLSVLPTRELISPLQRLLFPSFSELVPEPDRLRRVARESINVLGSLSLPAGFGFALVAPAFIPLAIGEQWLAIIPLVSVLVPYLGVRATLSNVLPCMMALGHTRLLFRVSLLYALVHVPAFVVGTALYGLEGAIWSLVAAGVLYTYLNAWMLRRALGITLIEILTQLRRPTASTVAMVAAVLALRATALPPGLPPAASLALEVLAGASTYAATLALLWHLERRPEGLESRLVQLWRARGT
ncbi:MAG: lipopolysaccharide biosynthesis protein, partial [Holophagales bacterium]|nr:lipopolysaccharide biosynthesis protein [Holophagales bacterium]